MKLQVYPEDIKNGVRMDCRRCPISLALIRWLRVNGIEGEPWVIGRSSMVWQGTKRVMKITNTDEIFTFIAKYDGGYDMSPQIFEIDDSCIEYAQIVGEPWVVESQSQ